MTLVEWVGAVVMPAAVPVNTVDELAASVDVTAEVGEV